MISIILVVIIFIFAMSIFEWIQDNPLISSVVFAVLILMVIMIKVLIDRHKDKVAQEAVSRLSMEDIDMMSGEEFEQFVAALLRRNGFTSIQMTPRTGDHGIDILAIRNGTHFAVQCKRYSKKVGNKAIQEAFSGQHFYKVDKAMVVTNNWFTKNAMNEAKRLKVDLWDREVIQKEIRSGIEKVKRN